MGDEFQLYRSQIRTPHPPAFPGISGPPEEPPADRWPPHPTGLGRWSQLVQVGHDKTGIDGEPFPTDQTLLDATRNNPFEDQPEQVAVAELVVAVLGERRMIRDTPVESEPTEPPMGQVQMQLLAQPPL